MSDLDPSRKALGDLQALRQALAAPKGPGAFAVQSVDTYLLLHVGALTFAVALGGCQLAAGLIGTDPTADLLALSSPANAALRWPLIEPAAGIVAASMGLAYGFIAFRARRERVRFAAFAERHFDYFKNFAALSDAFVKVAVFALMVLAGKTEWLAPLFTLFVGDIALQGRLLALPSRDSIPAGLACIGLAMSLFATGATSLLWPIAVGAVLVAWSLGLIVRFRQGLVAGRGEMDAKAFLALDPLLADRTRLLIMATLAREAAPVAFSALAGRLNLTRGNLSTHARKLEEAGLVAVEKAFLDRKPVTTFACTDKGRREIDATLAALEGVLRGTANGTGENIT